MAGKRRFTRAALAAGLALALTPLARIGAALAEDAQYEVTQIKQAFDPDAIDVPAGATVSFNNADDVNHNLQSRGPDGQMVDHGLQKPGETTQIGFPVAGVYTITCRIHPRMKMKVTVH